jgi:hypothetical protein
MFLRQTLLAALLVSGSTAVASAQTEEFPFRRFGSRDRIMLHPDVRTFRFSSRDMDRMRASAETDAGPFSGTQPRHDQPDEAPGILRTGLRDATAEIAILPSMTSPAAISSSFAPATSS